MPERKLDAKEAATLYAQGYTLASLALWYGVSKEAVRLALKREGVTLRPRGGNQGPHSRHRL